MEGVRSEESILIGGGLGGGVHSWESNFLTYKHEQIKIRASPIGMVYGYEGDG